MGAGAGEVDGIGWGTIGSLPTLPFTVFFHSACCCSSRSARSSGRTATRPRARRSPSGCRARSRSGERSSPAKGYGAPNAGGWDGRNGVWLRAEDWAGTGNDSGCWWVGGDYGPKNGS